MKLVYVEWLDSESQDGWHPIDGLDTSMTHINSVGYLIVDEPDRIVLGPNYDKKNHAVCQPITIPRCCIVKMEEIV